MKLAVHTMDPCLIPRDADTNLAMLNTGQEQFERQRKGICLEDTDFPILSIEEGDVVPYICSI